MVSHSHMKGKKAISLGEKDVGKYGMWLLLGLSLLALIYMYCSILEGFSTNKSILSYKENVSAAEPSTGVPNTKVQDQFAGAKNDSEKVDATELENETAHDTLPKDENDLKHNGEALEKVEHQKKISCNFENKDYDLCEMEGDIQIHGIASHVMFVDPDQSTETEPNKTWTIRPHAHFDKEEKVHCYPHVIVGSYRHNDLTIDPSRSPNNYSMIDFGLFVRKAFSLKRDHLMKYRGKSKKKPRLFIIVRKRIRQFRNINSIVSMAKKLGFEVISGDVPYDVNEAAHFINSFDVIMGVHGSGLTNLIFLPTNAIVIQIVPYGNIEWMAHYDFGAPSIDMKLNYLQYSINVQESTLTEIYPKDHPVLTDVNSIREESWDKYWGIYFDKQDVKLNVTRFRPTLVKALELLS
ncbi:hypothetical protein LUZ60_009849 [Juncus effusus]|nr:hypothetical protein LUZ60_009849 [Juncus effusus]